MELIIEILWQFFGELLLQVIAELLMELGVHCYSKASRSPATTIVSVIAYIVCGVVLGYVSLMVVPSSLIHSPTLRLVNLVVTPLVAGTLMMLIGQYRANHDKPVIRLETFAYGFIFAFSMSFVRYLGTA